VAQIFLCGTDLFMCDVIETTIGSGEYAVIIIAYLRKVLVGI